MQCPKCKVNNPDDSQFCKKCGTSLTEIPATLTSPPPEKEKTLEKSFLDFAPGEYFGKRYQIIEEIGRGGMGRVYKALDKELNRTVALKMIKPELSSHPGIVERFKKEIKLASKITHENVCRIHDLGEVEGIKYISMQFIEGHNLHEFIQASKGLKVETAINITEQICQALTTAHKQGVIHRDLKPQNIMIEKKGNAYVMDFGIARSLEAEEVTKPGVVIGTPHYMSPEQGEGKAADSRSDIYSLGCILYEMLTGKPPFEADTTAALIHKHIKESPKAPSKVNPLIPKAFEDIILKCLEKKPEKRYQKADEIIKAITEEKPELISAAKPAKIGWKLIVPIAAIILIGVAIGFYYLMIKEKPPTPSIPTAWKNSIAVLPFEDLSPQKDQEYFCDGMAEELINALTKIKDLRVIARTSAFAFKGKHEDIREIGRKLDVATLLEGSIRKSGNRLRITAQLVNVADGSHLWSESYDREMEDVFDIQDDITERIIDKMKTALVVPRKSQIERHSDNLEAYELYLKGRYYMNKLSPDWMDKTLAYYEQAIEKDPDYALAYAALAEAYALLSIGFAVLPSKDTMPKAREAALKALQLDPKLAEGHLALALIATCYDWDRAAAKKYFKKAIELNPNCAGAHMWYEIYLSLLEGNFSLAITEIKKAQELDPLNLYIKVRLGMVYAYLYQFNRAVDLFKKIVELEPNYSLGHLVLMNVYGAKGMFDEAIAEGEIVLKLGERAVAHVGGLGYCYALAGKKAKAYHLLAELEERSKKGYVSSFWIATIYLGLAETDQAFEWLYKAYDERDGNLIYLAIPPLFDSIRDNPRYKKLLKKMGLEHLLNKQSLIEGYWKNSAGKGLKE